MSIPLPSTYNCTYKLYNKYDSEKKQEKEANVSHIHTGTMDSSLDNKDGNNNKTRIHINDLFLSADERYEIFEIKAAERPHLLYYDDSSNTKTTNSDNKNMDMDEKKSCTCSSQESDHSDSDYDPPLIDGCDIPGWRKDEIAAAATTATTDNDDGNGNSNSNSNINSNSSNKNKLKYDVQALLNIGPSSTMFRRDSQWLNIDKYIQAKNHKWKRLKKMLLKEPLETVQAKVVQYEECCQEILHVNDIVIIMDNENNTNKNNTNTNKNNKNESNKNKNSTIDNYNEKDKVTRFAIEFEHANIPAKIMGATKDWACMPDKKTNLQQQTNTWTFANLVERFGHIHWRFSDTHGEMMSLKTYAKYIQNVEGLLDDSPLGIYDAEFGDLDSPTSELTREYTVPNCFSADLFALTSSVKYDDENDDEEYDGEDEEDGNEMNDNSSSRPPWRWILIGPERSGTGLHIDPLWTNAWVTVIQGKKRWCLFPPQTPKHLIGMDDERPQINSVSWYNSYYEKVTSSDWPLEYKPVEVLQLPGETVFVPNGWPHIVVNLETTVAVTHNYASEFGPFERMFDEVSRDEPRFARQWLEGMKNERPDLYLRADREGTK